MAQNEVAKRLVLIGGSAGSLDVIFDLLPSLPAGAGAAYVVVIHRKTDGDSALADLLATHTKLHVREVEDKEPIVSDTLYLAPADYHLLIENRHSFSLDTSEKVHYSRPSIDVSFESAADVFGEGTIGVLLSGANADGAAGLGKIRDAGGFTLVQNPTSASVAYMPQQAVKRGAAQQIVEAEKIGEVLRAYLKK